MSQTIEAVKERGILMTGEMVRATMRPIDPKTNTRRDRGLKEINEAPHEIETISHIPEVDPEGQWSVVSTSQPRYYINCPYGKVGDRLWVRENWRLSAWNWDEPNQLFEYQADSAKEWHDLPEDDFEKWNDWLIRETDRVCNIPGAMWIGTDGKRRKRAKDEDCRLDLSGCKVPWRPSLFLPQWASRISLEITSLKVERLQDISDEDAQAEGINREYLTKKGISTPDSWEEFIARNYHKRGFQILWESLHGKDSWDLNPWLWCIGFRRLNP